MLRHLLRAASSLCGLALAFSVAAQSAPRSYAVISEMAREVSVVSFQESTGSRLGSNLRTRIDIPEGALDKVALLAARQALNQASAAAPVWLLAPMDSDLFDVLQNPAEGDSVTLPQDLADAMKQRGTTHLLLMQRFRGDAQLQAARSRIGTGKLEGLGFFVDRVTPMKIVGGAPEVRGFIAPYVYVRLSVVDARSGKVLRTRVGLQSQVMASTETMAGKHPWDIFTAAEKVELLRSRMVDEITRTVPELLTGL